MEIRPEHVNIIKSVNESVLKWFGHVERMSGERLIKRTEVEVQARMRSLERW